MDVFVNTLSVTRRKGGIRTFLTSLIQGLVATDTANEYHLICGRHNRELFAPLVTNAPRFSCHTVGLSSGSALARIAYDQWVVPRRTPPSHGAVLLTPSNVCSLRATLPQVVVIQSSLCLRSVRRETTAYGRLLSRAQAAYFDRMMAPSLRKAAQVVCVSAYLRDRLVSEYPFVAPKVHVILQGVDADRFSAVRQPDPTSSSPDGDSPPYLLFVSTLFPYKNADRLLEAFAILHRDRSILPEFRLKFAGADANGRQIPALTDRARQLGVAHRVDFLGRVPYEKLAGLYRAAAVMIYPSAVESFGLPVLEAMACGTPVVASNRMSIPEVVGDAGLIADPDDVHALTRAIERLTNDAPLRNRLIQHGRQRAAQLTWPRAAQQLTQVLRLAAERPPLRAAS